MFLFPPSYVFSDSSIFVCRTNRLSVGGLHGETTGGSRGSSLTNGELSEEPGSCARHPPLKSHGSPGGSAGKYSAEHVDNNQQV